MTADERHRQEVARLHRAQDRLWPRVLGGDGRATAAYQRLAGRLATLHGVKR